MSGLSKVEMSAFMDGWGSMETERPGLYVQGKDLAKPNLSTIKYEFETSVGLRSVGHHPSASVGAERSRPLRKSSLEENLSHHAFILVIQQVAMEQGHSRITGSVKSMMRQCP
jgi:hypothetical protein